jgi:hypothetical protein
MPRLKKVFFSEDGSVLFFWLEAGILEWILLPDIEQGEEDRGLETDEE